MNQLKPGEVICPFCGHDNSKEKNDVSFLCEGTILQGKYLVGKLLRHTDLSAVYQGIVLLKECFGTRVFIKEFFPYFLAFRFVKYADKNTYRFKIPAASEIKTVNKRRRIFEMESQVLSDMDRDWALEPCIDYFNENGTSYMVSWNLESDSDLMVDTLYDWEIQGHGISPDFILNHLRIESLMAKIKFLHHNHIIHGNINPQNLTIVRNFDGFDTWFMLCGFGEGNKSKVQTEYESVNDGRVIIPDRYAAPEQYKKSAKLGPYTDIYGLCSTLYYAFTGKEPYNYCDRMEGKENVPLSKFNLDIPKNIADAVMHGMSFNYKDRPQSMEEFIMELL